MSDNFYQFTVINEVASVITKLSKEYGISPEEVLRKAISTEVFFNEKCKEGNKIFLRKDDQEIKVEFNFK